MKIFREVIIIFGIYILGEVISSVCKLPLPGSLVGMILLVALLQFRIINLEQIATVSDFLLGHLPFFFIPAGVALIAVFPMILHNWYWILLICGITTFLTMGISAKTIQKMISRKHGS